MSVQDFQLNCTIRSVLARHWIDSQLLSYRSQRGNVHLSGEFKTYGPAQDQQGNANTLQTLEAEVRQLRGVKSVQLELTNWFRNESGTWVCLEKESTSTQRNAATRTEAPKIIDLSNGRPAG